MSSKKEPRTRRVTFKKADYEKFAAKLDEWSSTLPPEERALLIAVLEKGSIGIRKADEDVAQTATPVSKTARAFDLKHFVVKLLLALQGISTVVDESGPEWIQEVTSGKT